MSKKKKSIFLRNHDIVTTPKKINNDLILSNDTIESISQELTILKGEITVPGILAGSGERYVSI